MLKLSGLLTFWRPPSTLGLSPHVVVQPAALLSPQQSYPKSTLARSRTWVRTITAAAPAPGSVPPTLLAAYQSRQAVAKLLLQLFSVKVLADWSTLTGSKSGLTGLNLRTGLVLLVDSWVLRQGLGFA